MPTCRHEMGCRQRSPRVKVDESGVRSLSDWPVDGLSVSDPSGHVTEPWDGKFRPAPAPGARARATRCSRTSAMLDSV
jgi:hypothetical protein